MINLTGQTGREAIPGFTAANFAVTSVPEPSSLSMLVGLDLIGGCCILRRKRFYSAPSRSRLFVIQRKAAVPVI
jgi:hypothetical protein